MSVATLLARGRRAAERLMVDACLIRRRTGETTDPTTGVVTTSYATVYEGKCRVQQPTAVARPVDAGQASLLLLRLAVQVPMSVVGVAADDEVLITASVLDPDLPGRRLVVRDLAHKSHATARRLGVEEVTS